MNFIINTLTSWDEPERARHQLTNSLIHKGHTVIFIEKNKTGWFKTSTIPVKDRLSLFTPFFPLDYRFRYRIPIINELFQNWLYKTIQKQYPDYLMINFDFTAHLLFRYYPLTVYYCNDYYIGNSSLNLPFINVYHSYCEKKLIKHSWFCIGTTHFLTERLKSLNSNSYLITLGSSISNFNSDIRVTVSKNNKTGSIKTVLVGFIATRYISPEIINEISNNQDVELNVIGPVETEFIQRIKHPEKIIFSGVLNGEALHQAISRSDVTIAAYNLTKVNPGTSPNKMWQYFSFGKPMVINNLPSLKDFEIPQNLVFVAKDEIDFVNKIRQAYLTDSAELAKKRIEFAKQNSWERRSEDFLQYLQHHLEQQSGSVKVMGFNVFSRPLNSIDLKNRQTIINTINAYSYVLTKKDNLFKESLETSDVLLPDGFPVVVAAKLIANQRIKKIAGADVFFYLLQYAFERKLSCFFMGSSNEVLDLIKLRFSKEYPGLKAAFYSPPYSKEFSKEENDLIISEINKNEPFVLFVGMTAPRQEKWVYQNKNEISAKVIASIGAVFDFYAGTKPRPHPILIKLNLEWLGRLIKEPKRLWKRYLIYSPIFFNDMIKTKWGITKG